jgi:hypothetical protein
MPKLDLAENKMLKSELEERILSNRSLLQAVKTSRAQSAKSEVGANEAKSLGDTNKLIS